MVRPNPFRDVLGIRIAFPEPGRCVATLPPSPVVLDARGELAQGAIATLVDVAIGHAIGSLAGPDEPFATVQLQIAFHAASGTGPLTAGARCPVLPAGWQEVMTDCTVRTSDGTLVATALGYFARRPGSSDPIARMPAATPDAQPGSFSALIGLERSEDGLRLRVGPQLLNLDGVAHGGAVAASLDLAMRAALQDAGAGDGLACRTLDVRYILPAMAGENRLRTEVERKGRAIHYVQARVVDPAGSLRASAVGVYADQRAK